MSAVFALQRHHDQVVAAQLPVDGLDLLSALGGEGRRDGEVFPPAALPGLILDDDVAQVLSDHLSHRALEGLCVQADDLEGERAGVREEVFLAAHGSLIIPSVPPRRVDLNESRLEVTAPEAGLSLTWPFLGYSLLNRPERK